MDNGGGCSDVFVFYLHIGVGDIHWSEEGAPIINSLTAMGVHGRPHFNELRSTVVSCRIFIHSQSLIAH